MPLYEYKCKQCGRHTEKRQKFSDPEITECPSCNGPLERVISAPAISFKGSGWYKDLYSSPKPASGTKAGEAVGASAPAESSGSGSSSEGGSKPSGDSGSSSGAAAAPSPATTAAPAKPTN